MSTAGFHGANQISEDIQEVRNDINQIKETQSTIVSSITDNESVLTQVANQMTFHQNYPTPSGPYDGRYSFVPSAFITPSSSTEDASMPHQQANMTGTTLPPELKTFMKTITKEINTLKTQKGFPTPSQPSAPQLPPNGYPPFPPQALQPFHPGTTNPHQPPYGYFFSPTFAPAGRGGGRQFNRGGRGGGRNGGRNNGRFGRGSGGFQRNQRRNLSHYCWTHGACSHPSWLCENPAHGHNYYATFDNKCGGSTYYCPRAT